MNPAFPRLLSAFGQVRFDSTVIIFLLGIAFTVVATVAIHTKRPGLEGLLDFYLAHRIHTVCSAVPLVYCPPLLDGLPSGFL
jgi:hypothetical protein